MGKNLYGAGEAGNNLDSMTTYSAGSGYPISFGRGQWSNGVLETISANDDDKVRFVWDVDGKKSGAVYVGQHLVSSKIVDVSTAKIGELTNVTITYIDIDGSIKSNLISITTPESIDDMQEFLSSSLVTAGASSAITVEEGTNDRGFKKYDLTVNVDNNSVKVVDNKLAVATYTLEQVPSAEVGDWASQYKLMITPPGGEKTQLGTTINIPKDRMVRSAHVCTFNRNAQGEVIETYVDGTPLYALVDGVLEPAPTGYEIEFNHTYLHLIINTSDGKEDGSGNDDTNDVYLDFTEIFYAGAFSELNDTVNDHEERISAIEDSYVKTITVGNESNQFKTVTITTSADGTDTATTFDIPAQSYYNQVEDNFNVIEENTAIFKDALTWGGLD